MVDHNRSPSRAWALKAPLPQTTGLSLTLNNGATDKIAAVYNQAGDNYAAYADGDPTQLLAFEGMHAYADRRVWAGIGAYRIPVESTVEKIDVARKLGADGIILFSYDFTATPGSLNPAGDYLERVRRAAFDSSRADPSP